jgi:hypothetical protein
MKSQHTTRRAVLAGASAMPIVVIAETAAAASKCDEQRLFAIEAEVTELTARAKTAGHVFDEAEETMFEWRRRDPEPTVRESRKEIEKKFDPVSGFEELRWRFDDADLEAATQEHDLAMNEWCAREQLAKNECGYDVKQAGFNKLLEEEEALYDEVAEIPARTMDGLRCKARLAKASDDFPELMQSIVDDVLALKA